MRAPARGLPALASALALAGCAALHPLLGGEPRLRALLEQSLPGAEVSELRPGVAAAKWLGDGPLAWHVLAIDLAREDLSFRPILAGDRIDGGAAAREPLSSMARRTGALAAIPADYPGELLQVSGLTAIDGKIDFAPRQGRRSALILSRKNRVWIGPFDPDRDPEPEYFEAVGGGPALLEKGFFQLKAEGAGKVNGEDLGGTPSDWLGRRGWTLAGLSKDRRTLFWLVSPQGPAWYSAGAGPEQLREVLARLSCEEAIAFQGGPAAELYADGRVLSAPPGEAALELPLGSALGLYAVR